ncbi:MAG TPA: GlmU family protein [Saprospiraceae bacterium]|nr:GlmU family protein [Saprospiraceae bacterium]
MRNLILFDDETREHLLPLTHTRPSSMLLCGILNLCEKWENYLQGKASFITSEYLTGKFPIQIHDENLVINGTILPNTRLVKLIGELKANEALTAEGDLVAANIPGSEFDAIIDGTFANEIAGYKLTETPVSQIRRSWDLLRLCKDELLRDFELITKNRSSQTLDVTNVMIGDGDLFMEEGASVYGSMFNTHAGPIYIGKGATIMEGCFIRGPVAIREGAVLKMGTKLYGPVVIGPYAKVGGEINHSIVMAYSNKSHDGYLGNSVIGEWCNLGAGTNVSNLKNNYSEVRMWNYVQQRFEHTGQQFLGIVMGDHTKCGISTMFNTGTVIGVSANIYGAGYPRNFIPSFSWGGAAGWQTFQLDKALALATTVMDRRGMTFTAADRDILTYVFNLAAPYRTWEKK